MAEAQLNSTATESENEAPEADSDGQRDINPALHPHHYQDQNDMDHTESESAEADLSPGDMEGDEADLHQQGPNEVVEADLSLDHGAVGGNVLLLPSALPVQLNVDEIETARSPSPAEADMMANDDVEAESSCIQDLQGSVGNGSNCIDDSRSDSPAEEDRNSMTDSLHQDLSCSSDNASEESNSHDATGHDGDQDSGPENSFPDPQPESAAVESELQEEAAQCAQACHSKQGSDSQANSAGFVNGSSGSDMSESAEPCEPECDWGSQGATGSQLPSCAERATSDDVVLALNRDGGQDLECVEASPDDEGQGNKPDTVSVQVSTCDKHALAMSNHGNPECGDPPSPPACEDNKAPSNVSMVTSNSGTCKLEEQTLQAKPDHTGDCPSQEDDEEGRSLLFNAIHAGMQEVINKSSTFLDSDPPSTAEGSERGSPLHHVHEQLPATESSLHAVALDVTESEHFVDRSNTKLVETPNVVPCTQASGFNSNQEHVEMKCNVRSNIPLEGNQIQSTGVSVNSSDIEGESSQSHSNDNPPPTLLALSIHNSSSNPSPTNVASDNASSPSAASQATVVTSSCSSDFREVPEDELLTELDAVLETEAKVSEAAFFPNGVSKFPLSAIPQYQQLKALCEQQGEEIKCLKESLEQKTTSLRLAAEEKEKLGNQLKQFQEKSTEEIYESTIKELEVKTVSLEKELKLSRQKLQSHDAAAKRTVVALQGELKSRVEQVTKLYEDCKKEKETMTVRYAQAEHKNLEMGSRVFNVEKRMKEIAREREIMIQRFHELKTDKNKAASLFESKNQEMAGLRRELERVKEVMSSQDVKVKWAQNKLKAELEAHKETKGKLEESNRKIKEAKEETEMIRSDCQAMVKRFQESEETKSVALDKELKVKVEQLQMQKQEKTDQEEVYYIVLRELESLKKKHKDALEENKTWKDKVRAQELERTSQEQHLEKYRETLQKQKTDMAALHKRISEQKEMEEDYKVVKGKWDAMEKRVAELEESNQEIEGDMSNCAKRESENLLFTQKISDKNAKLQSENTTINTKVVGLGAEVERLSEQVDELQARSGRLARDLEEEKRLRKEENDMLTVKLGEKAKAVEQLSMQVEEERDENRTLKRKHAANTKDLTRQLQQVKKRLESFENKDSTSQGSMGSRTPSNGSLDTLTNHNLAAANTGPVSRTPSLESPPQEEYEPVVRVVEVDKQMLVEKIVRLQKAHARKNEKLEFMEDHINQLLEEVRRKNKIIQNYALREEAGTLSPEVSDENKTAQRKAAQAQIARKGGIMASLYSSHPQDGNMTLDLSLDINRKLQAVLEDTLLKNITLKDNLQTLGEEIARLSQQNRKLQLSMQSGKNPGH